MASLVVNSPRWRSADAEITGSSSENPELRRVLSFKLGVDQNIALCACSLPEIFARRFIELHFFFPILFKHKVACDMNTELDVGCDFPDLFHSDWMLTIGRSLTINIQ